MTMFHVAFKIILRLVLTLLSIVGFLVRPFLILYGYVCTPRRKLPPFKDPLLEIPAVDLAEQIRNRQVKCNAIAMVVRWPSMMLQQVDRRDWNILVRKEVDAYVS